MAIVCPTVLAANVNEYKHQIEKIAHLGKRIQIDLTDGKFASTTTVNPAQIWWPAGFLADIHLMYQNPSSVLKLLTELSPNMIILHSEAAGNFNENYRVCRDSGIKLGIALLPATSPEVIASELPSIDHVLIFSGDLGSFGGHADLRLLDKVAVLKKLKPQLEIGWDGGINDNNIAELILGGVDVLNVGGYIQKAADPEKAYSTLFRIAEETGTA